ncbi:MAG: hypothetical protein U0Q15_20585 [Kineosporiaceae bacterium]
MQCALQRHPHDGDVDAAARRDAALAVALQEALGRGVDGEDDVLALAEAYPRLLLWLPDERGRLARTGRGERRSRGAFATPPGLARERAGTALAPLLDAGLLPRVVDPACGAGALLRAGLAVLLERGVAPHRAAGLLHGVELDPLAASLARAALGVDLRRAGLAVAAPGPRRAPASAQGTAPRIVVGDALLGPVPATASPDRSDGTAGDAAGLAWHEAFADVLDRAEEDPERVTGWRGGFDAVLANPPWERWKVHARDWAGAPPSGLRDSRASAAARVRADGRHPLTGRGEVNAYLPFLETCWRLLAPRGRGCVVVPAGVATDRSASALVLALVETGSLERLRLLAEGEATFADVSTRVPVAVLDLRAGAPRTPCPPTQPVPPATVEPVGAGSPWPLDAASMRLVGPNVATVPLCASAQEYRLLRRTHERWPVLVPRDAEGLPLPGGNPWRARFVTPLHMSRDARHFRTAPGPGLVPVWEAKQAGLLDHRGGSAPAPRYWVPEELMAQRHPGLWSRGWLLGYRNVSVSEGVRTLLPCALPLVAVGNSLPLVDAADLPLLLAVLAAAPLDHLLRARHAGANLNFFKLEQLPVPPPSRFAVADADGVTLADLLRVALAEAVAWRDGEPAGLARELGLRAAPAADPDPAALARARARLDGGVAWALGWSAEEVATAFASFPRWAAQERQRHGRFVAAEDAAVAYEGFVRRFGPA